MGESLSPMRLCRESYLAMRV
ncbi:Protein of unknown function [Bacillus mycoides]|nr:Protein of unknown function [Bacillus mycoides]